MSATQGSGSLYAYPGIRGRELIVNGNMEAGSPPAGWSAGADAPILASVADQHPHGAGTKSLGVTIGAGQTTGTVLTGCLPQQLGTYRLSAWLKNVNAARCDLVIYTSEFSVLAEISGLTPANWMEYTVDFIYPGGAMGFFALVVWGAEGQSARLDDVSVRRV